MSNVFLKKLKVINFGPIKNDEVSLEPFTYFIGRNNSGKSHYLKAIELLLSPKDPSSEEIIKLQNDKSQAIRIEGEFKGVSDFTSLVTSSNHKESIDNAIKDGVLRVVRNLFPNNDEKTMFGIYDNKGEIHNPGGFKTNLLKVLPEPITILAIADTADELKNTQNTALSKLKKEALTVFFEELKIKTQETLIKLDEYLHSKDCTQRSSELTKFENNLKEELMGEFSDVVPSIEFTLPNEEVIAKEMKIFLDDGYKSEIEQKGHGLQRAMLLALLKVLAKHGAKYQERPSPIFLIGEIESFLHPFAQKQLSEILLRLSDQYQLVTTTHSPFIISPQAIEGYRRIQKNGFGTHSISVQKDGTDINLIKRLLERRDNLEGLFADRIILIEGCHDENFFYKLLEIFDIHLPENKFTRFIKTNGKSDLRQARRFYQQMNFEDVSIICDLDYLFSCDFVYLLQELNLGGQYSKELREYIEWNTNGDPPLNTVIKKLEEKGQPAFLKNIIEQLSNSKIFVLSKGAPEHYYKNSPGIKNGWEEIKSENDLLESDYLKQIMISIIS